MEKKVICSVIKGNDEWKVAQSDHSILIYTTKLTRVPGRPRLVEENDVTIDIRKSFSSEEDISAIAEKILNVLCGE